MNRKIAIALAIAAAAAGNAFAEDYNGYNPAFQSTLSRAQVQAELAQFQQAGVNPWSKSFDLLRGFQSTRSRADVVAEYVASRGRVAAMTGEDSGSAYLAAAQPGSARALLAGSPRSAQ